VGTPAFFATAGEALWRVEFAADCAAGLCVLFEVELSVAHKPLAAKQTPDSRTSRSSLGL